MKYIIELEDEPMIANSFHQEADELWKAKGFNSLVFDKCGLDKLTPYTELDRSVIEDEVWGVCKKLISMSENEVSDMMGCMTNFGEVMYNVPYQEAKAKYEAWRAERDEIRVGDEVEEIALNMRGIVTWIGDASCSVMWDDGRPSTEFQKELRRTGRHFDEVEELLEKIKED